MPRLSKYNHVVSIQSIQNTAIEFEIVFLYSKQFTLKLLCHLAQLLQSASCDTDFKPRSSWFDHGQAKCFG